VISPVRMQIPPFDSTQRKPPKTRNSDQRMSTEHPVLPSLTQSLASSESTLEQNGMTDTKTKAVKSVRMEPDRVDSAVTHPGTVSEPDDIHDETTDHDHSEDENDGMKSTVFRC